MTPDRYADIQTRDDTAASTTFENKVKKQVERRLHQETLEIEAEVRSKIKDVEDALASGNTTLAADLLRVLHWYLWLDPNRRDVLAPTSDLPVWAKQGLIKCHKDRERGLSPDSHFEAKVLVEVAEAQEYISGARDLTRWAPVRFESIDEPGATTSVETPSPVGRVRIGATSTANLDDRVVEIPHQSCDHIAAVALPRRGKDSTLVSLGMNLQREHGYSYISIMDDGRMETPMTGIPNDEQVIRENLERFNQTPRAMNSEVFVPAMDGVPDELPSNFTLFTIGLDTLTPSLILRLAGVTKSDETVEARIKQALDETLSHGGSVTELVSRLQVYAKEMEATIEWTELEEKRTGERSTKTYTAHYQMSAESALEKAAQRLAQLAAEGLITSPSAATNLNMHDVVADQERAAVLCCNFLSQGLEALKYVVMDLWLRLIYKVRDRYPRLPRVCIEIRELKNIAPSKLADVRYKSDIKTLRQTIFFLTTQGGSRRILLLGSTQKWNDVYKPVRSNIATKILLQLGEDEIATLDDTHHFRYDQKEQLAEFNIGQGMVLAEGQHHWPIELRGAPCGLGLGDRHWRDRYGLAWGARVRESKHGGWRGSYNAPEWWIDANTLDIHAVDDDGPPDVGEWYLLPEDFPEGVGVEDLRDATPVLADTPIDTVLHGETPVNTGEALADGGDVETVSRARRIATHALEQRREYPLQADLSLRPTGYADKQRELSLGTADDPSGTDDLSEQFGIPESIRPWLQKPYTTREKLVEVVRVLAEHDDLDTQDKVAKKLSFSRSTMANHWSDKNGLKKCVDTDGRYYALTPVGRQAANLDWDAIEEAL